MSNQESVIQLIWSVVQVIDFFFFQKPSQVILKGSHSWEALMVLSLRQLQGFSRDHTYLSHRLQLGADANWYYPVQTWYPELC